MQNEISSGAMLGIVLIALAAIIGLGFGIFAIAKGTANDGVVQMQDQLGQVSLSTFNDYDQKVVTGTQVMSAYSNFAGKPYAILVATRSYLDGNESGLSEAPEVATNVRKLTFLNYNALLDGGKIKLENGTFIQPTTFTMDADTGKISYNTVTDKLSKSGQVEYVPTGARFEANLIKDASGSIMGVTFQQVSVK